MITTTENPFTKYGHTGWTGVPGKSSFISAWGTIPTEDICDCSEFPNVAKAGRHAEGLGFKYLYIPKRSRYGSDLYRRWSRKEFLCVNAYEKSRKSSLAYSVDKYRSSPETRIRQIVRGARQRAREKNIPFDLDEDEIVGRVLNGCCEATGMPFDLTDVGTNEVKNPFAPSLDQRVPGAGYTKSNVQIVVWGWNLMKSNFEEASLRLFLSRLGVPEGSASALPS